MVKADTTVILLRHTFRSFDESLKGGYANFSHINDYSAQPWPEYNVKPKDATQRGLDLAKQLGSFLPEKLSLAGPIEFIADIAERDIDTALYIANGMRSVHDSKSAFQVVGNVTTDASLFAPWKFINGCSAFLGAERGKAVEQQLKVVPEPKNMATLVESMQNITGKGAAPLLKDIDNWISDLGFYNGRLYLMSKFAGNFDLEYGNDVPVGWGKVSTNLVPGDDPSNMYNLLQAHVYYRAVNMKAPEVAAHDSSNMFNAILSKLDRGKDGVTFYLGHDADIDKVAVLLGVQFRLYPYNLNGVAPISGLKLTLANGKLTVSYIGAVWEPQGDNLVLTDVHSVPAPFVTDLYTEHPDQTEAMATVDYKQKRDAWVRKMFQPCVNNPVPANTGHQGSIIPMIVGISAASVVVFCIVMVVVIVVITKKKGDRGGFGPDSDPLTRGFNYRKTYT